jgi:hypothetical protein
MLSYPHGPECQTVERSAASQTLLPARPQPQVHDLGLLARPCPHSRRCRRSPLCTLIPVVQTRDLRLTATISSMESHINRHSLSGSTLQVMAACTTMRSLILTSCPSFPPSWPVSSARSYHSVRSSLPKYGSDLSQTPQPQPWASCIRSSPALCSRSS